MQWFDSSSDGLATFSEMGALGKMGLLLQNIADPTTLPKYQQALRQQEEDKLREKSVKLAQQEAERKIAQQSALAQLSADPSFAALPLLEQHAKAAAVTGDPSALLSFEASQRLTPYQEAELGLQRGTAAREDRKLQAELNRQKAIQDALGGLDVPPVDLASYTPALPNPGLGTAPLRESALQTFGPPAESFGPAAEPAKASALASLHANPALTAAHKLAIIDPEHYTDNYLSLLAKEQEKQQKEQDSVITPDNQNLTDEAFISSLQDRDVQNKARALLRGDIPYPTINSRTPTVMKQALEAAQQADPSYSAATYPVRRAAKIAFTTGQEAKNVNAINTIIHHIDQLDKTGDELGNSGNSYYNAAINAAEAPFSDKFNAKLNAYKTAKTAVGSEAAKAYKGVGAISLEEQREWQSTLSPNLGPETRKATVREILQLLAGKISALDNQWNTAFPGEPKTFLDAKSMKILKEKGLDITDFTGTADSADHTVIKFDAQGNIIQ